MVCESTSELGQSNQYVIAENLKYSSMSRVNGSHIQRLPSGSHLKLKFTNLFIHIFKLTFNTAI